jgi:predicted hotdog family 3-hydroxylacyl-ACP dehydratase
MPNPVPLAGPDRILELIPQRPPFVLVDALLSAADGTFSAAFTVPAVHVLVDDGVLGVPGLMEHVAQTAAAGIGQHAKERGVPTPIGFIASIDRLAVQRCPQSGEQLTTTVRTRNQVMDVHVLEGTVRAGDAVICTMDLKVFVLDGQRAA